MTADMLIVLAILAGAVTLFVTEVVDYLRAGTAMSVLFLLVSVPMLLWIA